MERVANREARTYVNNRDEFKGNNTFGVWENESVYVVYSYGKHFPMYVYDGFMDAWFGNHDKYSATTSKHQSQLRPSGSVLYKNTEFLKNVIYSGVIETLAK